MYTFRAYKSRTNVEHLTLGSGRATATEAGVGAAVFVEPVGEALVLHQLAIVHPPNCYCWTPFKNSDSLKPN